MNHAHRDHRTWASSAQTKAERKMLKYRNLGPLLLFGSSLFASDAGAAMLTAVQGDVRVDMGHGFVPATGAASLETGHKLQVGKGGAAQLIFSDGCVFPPAEGSTLVIGAQSPCAIRASFPRPSYVGGAASLYTHAISAPSKKLPAKHRSQAKIRQKPQLNNARWTTTTSPSGPVNPPQAIAPAQAGQLQSPVSLGPPMQIQALTPALPQLPSPVIASSGMGLSTGVLVAGGIAAVGGAALIISATQNREKNKAASP